MTRVQQLWLPCALLVAVVVSVRTGASENTSAAPPILGLSLLVDVAKPEDAKIQSHQKLWQWSLYGCRIEDYQVRGRDPLSGLSRTVEVSLYRARSVNSSRAAVMILPPTGGINIIDRGYANELCSSGLTAAIVSSWEHQDEVSLDFSMHDRGALRSLRATQHVLEFLRELNYQRIGVLGTSIGAISGALAFGVDQRISAAALIVGSARFADVIVESDESGASELRTNRMRRLGLRSIDDYRRAVRKDVTIEPKFFLEKQIQLGNFRETLIVSADQDTTVPTAYQYELAELLGSQHIRLRGDHFSAITKAFWYHSDEIAKFFAEALSASESTP